jgi:flagellar hook-length control protein FliK
MVQMPAQDMTAAQSPPAAKESSVPKGPAEQFQRILERQTVAGKREQPAQQQEACDSPPAPEAEEEETSVKDGASLEGKKQTKRSKCPTEALPEQAAEVVGILEGFGLLGTMEPQSLRQSADVPVAIAVEDADSRPEQAETDGLMTSARMPKSMAAELLSARKNALQQEDNDGCSLENSNNAPATGGEQQDRKLDKLAALFDRALAEGEVQIDEPGAAVSGDGTEPRARITSLQVSEETARTPDGDGETLDLEKAFHPDAATIPESASEMGQTAAVKPAGTGEMLSTPVETLTQGQAMDTEQVRGNLQQMVQTITTQVKEGVQEMEILLRPEHLGKLKISLRMEEGAISAALTAADHRVQEALQPHMEEMQTLLKDKGLPVTQVEVTWKQEAFQSNFSQQQNLNQRQNPALYGRRQSTVSVRGQEEGLQSTVLNLQQAPRLRTSLYSSMEFQA